MNNKISIIVPFYNSEKTLARCLDSIVHQSYDNIEIILVNDGSKDSSAEIARGYKEKYSEKIKLFNNNNMGVAEARNYGIEQVTGDYFLFVDADDTISNDLCFKIAEKVQTEQIDIIKYKMSINNEQIDGPVFGKVSGEEAFNRMCFSDVMIDSPCVYLFRTEFYKNNKFKFLKNTYHEDFGLIPIIIIKATSFLSTDICGYNYIQEGHSITRDNDYAQIIKRTKDLLLHYDNMLTEIQNVNIANLTQENIKVYYTNCILNAMKKLDKKDKQLYKKEILKRNLIKNIKVRNIKSFIKRIFFGVLIKL